MARFRKCRNCRRHKKLNGWPYCSVDCENRWRAQHNKTEMSAAEVDRVLANSVRLECAMPWVKKPQDWD